MISKNAIAVFLMAAVAVTPSYAFVPCNSRGVATWGSHVCHMSAVATYEAALEKMSAKDKTSTALSKEDLKVVYDDEHIVVIDKPAGVLCVPGKESNPSLASAVFEAFGCESGNVDKMVAQRLGFDTSGLVAFAKTNAALSKLNQLLRAQKISRKYEALVTGTVSEESGSIEFPLQRNPENLPFMKVSDEESMRALLGIADDLPKELKKKFIKNPMRCLTTYEVVGKEELDGQDVTRVSLTSVTGRTHQLNVHCAAFGHPIVGDSIYGNGDADGAPKVHLKELSFEHPITREKLSFSSDSPF